MELEQYLQVNMIILEEIEGEAKELKKIYPQLNRFEATVRQAKEIAAEICNHELEDHL